MKNKKILFPTDFTTQSVRALKETIELNQQLGFEVIIFHSYSRPYTEGFDQKGQLDKVEKDADKSFDKITKEIPELQSQQHSFRKILGDTIDSVVELVEKEAIDLIVMSTKGAAGLGELFGTKTAKIIKSVAVPVIVIPADSSLMPIGKLGLACDYSHETPQGKLDFLTHLAAVIKPDLELITLNRDEKTMTKQEQKNRESLVGAMEKLAHKSSFIEHDDVKWGLIEYAESNELDMIAVIPKSYTYIERVFHESLTQKMAFHSPIPVLVLQ